jgi:hypothetical protein
VAALTVPWVRCCTPGKWPARGAASPSPRRAPARRRGPSAPPSAPAGRRGHTARGWARMVRRPKTELCAAGATDYDGEPGREWSGCGAQRRPGAAPPIPANLGGPGGPPGPPGPWARPPPVWPAWASGHLQAGGAHRAPVVLRDQAVAAPRTRRDGVGVPFRWSHRTRETLSAAAQPPRSAAKGWIVPAHASRAAFRFPAPYCRAAASAAIAPSRRASASICCASAAACARTAASITRLSL